jgi:hypothetical protein
VIVCAIDALLTLSRAELDPRNYESCERANVAVEKSLELAKISASRAQDRQDDASGASNARSSMNQPTLLRAISNTAYTLAGVLYNANMASRAISFVQKSCEVGERALELADSEDAEFKDKEIHALREHMPRRWELLAICRLKATDRRGAVEAFGKALLWNVALLGSVQTLDEKTSQIIGQLVGIAVGDLFDPEIVTLGRLFVNISVEEHVMTLMMEKVVQVLEDMMHKPIAQRAMAIAVDELIRLWGDEHPMKKAK